MRIISLYLGDERYVLESQRRAARPARTRRSPRSSGTSPAWTRFQHAVRARDRGPGHGARRGDVSPAAGDGAPYRRRGHRPGGRARHRRPAAVAAARGADGRCRRRPRADRPRLPADRPARRGPIEHVLRELADLSAIDLLDLTQVARAMGLPSRRRAGRPRSARAGYRLLARVPRMPAGDPRPDRRALRRPAEAARRVGRGLQLVDGVGETRARAVREALSRLAEASIIDRFSCSLARG